ncbi:phage portal protein [Saccharothrix sp. HUAS TT1]|uniref:phage portal protein n=1 Tax=unclassified Saccharothrix TaxID=2593673 RepID=UPI00345C1B44
MTTAYDKDVTDLTNLLNTQQPALQENQDYYEAEYRLKALGLATPPEMRHLTAAIGYCRIYLDAIDERLDVEGFRSGDEAEADERLWDWWQANALDEEAPLGHLESMIHGVSYITVSVPDENDEDLDPTIPLIRVESPFHFVGTLDQRTRQIRRALRLYRSPESPQEDRVTLLLPDETVYLGRSQRPNAEWSVISSNKHNLGRPLVSPLINRERLSEPFGKSEMTPELRSATDAASRIMMNLQAAAELMAVPQRVLFGVAAEEFTNDPENPGAQLEAYYARMLAFEDSNGKIAQYSAADLRNFVEALQELAKQVASYTGLPPQYLSFSSENPASAEAIKSAESRLVKKSERKARMFGGAWERAMRLGMLAMDGSVPSDAYKLETVWRDPSTPTFAAKADGVAKLHAAHIIPTEQARIEMGYTDIQREQMREWEKDDPMSQLNAILAGGAGPGGPGGAPGGGAASGGSQQKKAPAK